MFTSGRRRGGSDSGRVSTRWLVGVTTLGLIVGSITLPQVAAEESPVPSATASSSAATTAPGTQPQTSESKPATQAPSAGTTPPTAASPAPTAAPSASDSATASPAPSPAPTGPATAAPPSSAAASPSAAPSSPTLPSVGTRDGPASADKAPPVVEERVNGLKAVPGDGQITVYWPDFGFEQNYVVQVQKGDGSWSTTDAKVKEPKTVYVDGDVAFKPPASADQAAVVDDLKDGKRYTLRVVSGKTLTDAKKATQDAVAAPGTGGKGASVAVRLVSGTVQSPAVASNEVTATTIDQPGTAPNPQLVDRCGLNIAIVVDRSGSIGWAGAEAMNQLKSALTGLMDSFVGTGTVVSLISYATTASTHVDNRRIVTQADANSLDPAIAGLKAEGSTNWQAAIKKVQGLSTRPDLVLFMTDGRPNTINSGSGILVPADYLGKPQDFSQTALNASILESNVVKRTGARMLGVAIASANTAGDFGERAIRAVSGNNRWQPGDSIRNRDFIAVSKFADLQSQLLSLASDLCTSLTKSNSPTGAVAPGTEITYTVTMKNIGDKVVTKPLVDDLPGAVTFKTGSATESGPATVAQPTVSTDPDGSQRLTWPAFALAKDQTQTYTYKVVVKSGLADQKAFKNHAMWNRLEAFTTNSVRNPGEPELAKTADRSVVEDGGVVTYTVKLTNTGGSAITSNLVDTLPVGVSYKAVDSGTSAPSSTTWPKVVWNDVTVAAGESRTFSYQVDVAKDLADGTELTNLATWSGRDDEVTVTVTNPGEPGLEKTADRAVVDDGGTVVYTVTLTNTGGAPVTSDLTDTLPEGITFKHPTGTTPAPTSVVGQLVTWKAVTVGPLGSRTFAYEVDVAAGLADGTELTNAASWAGRDDRVTVTVRNPGKPGLEKVSDPASGSRVAIGETITYTVTLTNTGGATLASDLVDTIPDGLSFQAVTGSTPAPSSVVGQVVTWTNVSVAAGVTKAFTYRVTVDGDVPVGTWLQNDATWSGLEDSTRHFAIAPLPVPFNVEPLQETCDPASPETIPARWTVPSPDLVDLFLVNGDALALLIPGQVQSFAAGPHTIRAIIRDQHQGYFFDLDAQGGLIRTYEVDFTVAPSVACPGLTKTSDPASGSDVEPGATIEYTVTLTNTGGTVAVSDLTDTLPVGVAFEQVTGSTPAIDSQAGQVITWQDVSVEPGQTVVLTYSVSVDQDAEVGSSLVNDAVWSDLHGRTTHRVVQGLTPVPFAGPALQETCDTATGQVVPAAYTVRTADFMSGALAHLIDIYLIEGPASSGAVGLMATATPRLLTPGQVLQLGQGSHTFQLRIKAAFGGYFFSLDEQGSPVRVATQAVEVAPSEACPALEKTASPASGSAVTREARISYAVTVRNNGGTQISAPIRDSLPEGFRINAASITGGGVLSADGRTITWEVTLPPGASQTFTCDGTVDVTVPAGAILTNRAQFQDLEASTTHTVVVPTVTPASNPTPAPTPTPTEELPPTGAGSTAGLAGLAVIAMLLGGAMVGLGRWRRRRG